MSYLSLELRYSLFMRCYLNLQEINGLLQFCVVIFELGNLCMRLRIQKGKQKKSKITTGIKSNDNYLQRQRLDLLTRGSQHACMQIIKITRPVACGGLYLQSESL